LLKDNWIASTPAHRQSIWLLFDFVAKQKFLIANVQVTIGDNWWRPIASTGCAMSGLIGKFKAGLKLEFF
jgi:hypothetical protein